MKDCNYPDCLNCTKDDCDMTEYDIIELSKHRRGIVKEKKPVVKKPKKVVKKKPKIDTVKCNKCRRCITVENEKMNGYKKLCLNKMRLIKSNISCTPDWCDMLPEE